MKLDPFPVTQHVDGTATPIYYSSSYRCGGHISIICDFFLFKYYPASYNLTASNRSSQNVLLLGGFTSLHERVSDLSEGSRIVNVQRHKLLI